MRQILLLYIDNGQPCDYAQHYLAADTAAVARAERRRLTRTSEPEPFTIQRRFQSTVLFSDT